MNWYTDTYLCEGTHYAVPMTTILAEGELNTKTLTSAPPTARSVGTDASKAKATLAVLIACQLNDTVTVEVNESGVVVVNPRGEGMTGPGPTDLLEIATDLRTRLQATTPGHALYILGSPAMHGDSAFESLLTAAAITPTEGESDFIEGLLSNTAQHVKAWAGELPDEWRRVTLRNDGCYNVMTETEADACVASRVESKLQEIKDGLSEEALPYFDEPSARTQMQEEASTSPEDCLSPVFKEAFTGVVCGEITVVARI